MAQKYHQEFKNPVICLEYPMSKHPPHLLSEAQG